MNDKKALLGELSIDDTQREADSRLPRFVITGGGTILLALRFKRYVTVAI